MPGRRRVAGAGGGAAGRGGRSGCRRSGAACGVAPVASMWSSTSSRVMRPPGPVPVIASGSRPCSLTRRRTTGESSRLSPACAVPLSGRGRFGSGGCGRGWCGRRGRFGSRGRFGGGAGCGRRVRCGRRFGGGCGRSRRCGAGLADDGDHGADVDRVAFLDADLGERSGHRRRHLGVDLVGRHLEERLVLGDRVTDRFEPLGDRSFGDRFAELRERDVCHVRVLCPEIWVLRGGGGSGDQPLKLRPVIESTVSPNNSLKLGWGWMNSAISSTVASQLTARYPPDSCSVTQGPTMCTPRI